VNEGGSRLGGKIKAGFQEWEGRDKKGRTHNMHRCLSTWGEEGFILT
jgi:hypothetical protein